MTEVQRPRDIEGIASLSDIELSQIRDKASPGKLSVDCGGTDSGWVRRFFVIFLPDFIDFLFCILYLLSLHVLLLRWY